MPTDEDQQRERGERGRERGRGRRKREEVKLPNIRYCNTASTHAEPGISLKLCERKGEAIQLYVVVLWSSIAYV